jgi:hypothetical protein
MNLPLLCAVLPLAAVLFVKAVLWIYSVYGRSPVQRNVIWGGLDTKERAAAWCLTYVLSSLGGLLTFYLCVVFTGDDDVLPVFLFGTLDISYIVYLYIVDDGLLRASLVRLCVWFNFILYVILFAYTLIKFPVDRADVSNATLIGVTHFCNAVAIFHALVMDAILWFEGWMTKLEYNSGF